ncbi:MAG: amidohydrolase family protein [Holophagales bacterium]|nr:amidohydrolase family protein [Holophagales bacterium]
MSCPRRARGNLDRAILLAGAAVLLLLLPGTTLAEPVAFVGATVHPVSGPPVEGATLVVDGGKIVALGAGMRAPDGARIVRLDGRHIYPGFTSAHSLLGLVEISSVRGTVDSHEIGDNNADPRAEAAWNADSLRLPVALAGGVLTAHVVQRGGSFLGTSAVMRLDGWNWEDMTVAAPVGMHLAFPAVASADDEDNEAQEKALETINEILEQARAYAKAHTAGSPGLDRNPKLEALIPLLEGEMRLFVHADSKAQIEAALDWTEEQGFQDLVLVVGPDARHVKERLAEAGVPVILNGVLRTPARAWEPYDAAYGAAAELHAAGIPFAIAHGGSDDDSANARNLPFHAAMAAAYGLPKDVALRSVTLAPAEILGIADRVGSLEAGKDADLIVTDGDPLEILTTIESVWVAGRQVDLENAHQYRLYQRYWDRPLPEGKTRKSETHTDP